MFEEIVAKREIIKMPTVDETRTEMMAMLAGVVFLH